MTALQTLIDRIDGMKPAERVALQKQLDEAGVLDQFEVWRPQEGPQTEGYFTQADLTLYGGAAGRGKTDLIAGLSLFAHYKVAIFRQSLKSLKGLIERMNTLMRSSGMGKIAGNPPRWVGPDERLIEFSHLGTPGSEEEWQGRDHDLKAFDEGAQLDPRKIIFVLGWLRSTRPGQRCRGLIATNPPLGGQGDFLVEWFAPWLDPLHPLYGTVAPGDLLWAVFIDDGDAIRMVWVDRPFEAHTVERLQNRLVLAALCNVDRQHIHGLAGINAIVIALEGKLDPIGRDHLPFMVLPSRHEIASLQRCAHRFRHLVKLRIVGLAQIGVVLALCRNERPAIGRSYLALDLDRFGPIRGA